jgi:hypothetical protein
MHVKLLEVCLRVVLYRYIAGMYLRRQLLCSVSLHVCWSFIRVGITRRAFVFGHYFIWQLSIAT